MISIGQSTFRQDIAKHLSSIKRLCKKHGVPTLGHRITLILRDPTNDDMSLVQTDEETLEEALRVARYLEERGL